MNKYLCWNCDNEKTWPLKIKVLQPVMIDENTYVQKTDIDEIKASNRYEAAHIYINKLVNKIDEKHNHEFLIGVKNINSGEIIRWNVYVKMHSQIIFRKIT